MDYNPSIEAYKTYKFTSDSDFIVYLDRFYPTPTGMLLEKQKRKYYKSKVDPVFDPNFDGIDERVS